MGFSAGGEVAALAASEFGRPVKGTSDSIDAMDCRPDFQALFYPGLPSPQPVPTPRTPPTFLCGAFDYGFHLTTPMVDYYLRLAEARVPTALPVYPPIRHRFPTRHPDPPPHACIP